MKVPSSISLLVLSILSFSFIQNPRVWANTESNAPQTDKSDLIQAMPALGYIQTRSRKIEIKANNTYTIYNQEGQILQENMTLENLKAENPDLYEMIENSLADETPMMMIFVK